MIFLAGTAGVVTIDGTVIVELIAFLAMLAVLSRYVYPWLVDCHRRAAAGDRAAAEDAEEARASAEARLKEAGDKLARGPQDGPGPHRGGNQVGRAAAPGAETKAEEESKRTVEAARKEIEA